MKKSPLSTIPISDSRRDEPQQTQNKGLQVAFGNDDADLLHIIFKSWNISKWKKEVLIIKFYFVGKDFSIESFRLFTNAAKNIYVNIFALKKNTICQILTVIISRWWKFQQFSFIKKTFDFSMTKIKIWRINL